MLFLACWFGLLVWVGACVVRLFAVVCVVGLLFYCSIADLLGLGVGWNWFG